MSCFLQVCTASLPHDIPLWLDSSPQQEREGSLLHQQFDAVQVRAACLSGTCDELSGASIDEIDDGGMVV